MGHIQYFDWGSIEWIYEPDTKNSTNTMHIGISTILPGRRQREHIHYGDEQLLYVLSGRGEQLIGKELSIKKPGSLFHIDAGSVHEAINTGEEPIKELLISVPVYYNQRNPLNDILNSEQIYIGNFKDTIILNDRIKHLYDEAIDILAIPLSIFNKVNEPIIVSDNYPEFCMKKCNVHKDVRNCHLYNIYDEYMPPHYKDPSAFVCQYGLRVFVMPIIINDSLVGTIKGGHIRIYDENHVGLKDESDSDYELYRKMQIVHQGRIMAILQHIKTLSKNISYYYLLENTEIELSKKEEIIKDIAKNELLKEPLFAAILGSAIAWGVKRGVYSNEAGQGSGAIVSAAEASHPAKQGLVQAFSVYIDTLVVCTATALMVILTNSYNVLDGSGNFIVEHLPGIEYGVLYTQYAVDTLFSGFGSKFVAVAIFLFAYTSLLAYYYQAESNISYMFPKNKTAIFAIRIIFILSSFSGVLNTSNLIWTCGDLGVGLMAWLNIIAILILSKQGIMLLKDYEEQKAQGIDPIFNPKLLNIKDSIWEEKYNSMNKNI